jgi:hypothetical protein
VLPTVGPLHNVIQHCAAGVPHLRLCVKLEGLDLDVGFVQLVLVSISVRGIKGQPRANCFGR